MSRLPTRRNQESGLARLHNDFDRMLDRFFGDWGLPSFGAAGTTAWPALDVMERDDAIVIKAEAPGMKPEDINVSVHGNALTISGEKKEEHEDKREGYYHTERRYGTFRRTVTLPSEVDVDKIEAAHRDGVLTITLPKSEQAKPRQIEVKP